MQLIRLALSCRISLCGRENNMVSIGSMINSKLKDVAQVKGYENAKQLTDALSEHLGKRISTVASIRFGITRLRTIRGAP